MARGRGCVCHAWNVDTITWGALALTLTLLGGIWTWLAFRRRGAAAGLRAAAFTLLPAAAWLTHTLQMFTRIGTAVADWAANLVFNPFVWSGVVLFGVSGVLFVVSGFMRSRQLANAPKPGRKRGRWLGRKQADKQGRATPGALPASAAGRSEPVVDDDMDEIEALLRKRGIT